MTLERLEFWDFQIHSHFQVDLDPACTTFVGESDKGKSSILRCLRWLATNRPSGEAFIRKGAKRSAVKLLVDGFEIGRRKGEDNLYHIDGKEFKAFGNDVPQPIAELLNIEDVSWGLQHDPPFWLSLTPGQAAKELNAVFSLDLIDRSLSNVGAMVRKATASVEISKERLGTARTRRKELRWVPDMVADLERVEASFIAGQESQESARRLADTVQAWKALEGAVTTARQRAYDAGQVSEKAGRGAESSRKVEVLAGLILQWKRLEDELCRERENAERVGRELAKIKTCPICGQTRKGI